MQPWIGSRRILWPTSISIVCSAYRDEGGGEHGNESDQDCVGATVKSERSPNIGGCCRIATGSHGGVVDTDCGIQTRACHRDRDGRAGGGRAPPPLPLRDSLRSANGGDEHRAAPRAKRPRPRSLSLSRLPR